MKVDLGHKESRDVSYPSMPVFSKKLNLLLNFSLNGGKKFPSGWGGRFTHGISG